MDKDRRKFKRFDAFMSVRYGNSQEAVRPLSVGLSKDVSRDGLCVNSNETLPQGALLDLEIDLPDDPRPVKTSGKVVWTKSASQEQGMDCGIQFVTIDPVDKFRVLDYAYNYWLETKVNDFSDPEDVSELK